MKLLPKIFKILFGSLILGFSLFMMLFLTSFCASILSAWICFGYVN